MQRIERKGRRRVLAATTIGWMLIAVTATVSRAQQTETDSAREVRHNKEAASLAKAAQNPVANMVSLPMQYNYYTNGGLGQASEMVLNVQPVVPLPIGKNWLIVSRTIVPFASIPLPLGSTVVGGNSAIAPQIGGIADIQEQAYFTSSKPGKFTWALGPIFSFPTATNRLARTGQWGLGPTAVGLTMPGPWVIGTLINNVWRIGGDAHGHVLNTFTLQPFINYNFGHGWAATSAPLITANWDAPSGEEWTVPLGIGISKTTVFNRRPMNIGLQYYHNVVHPDSGPSDQVRIILALLYPTARRPEGTK